WEHPARRLGIGLERRGRQVARDEHGRHGTGRAEVVHSGEAVSVDGYDEIQLTLSSGRRPITSQYVPAFSSRPEKRVSEPSMPRGVGAAKVMVATSSR